MRILTLAAMGASALALSGCSFLSGVFGHQPGTTSVQDDCCLHGPALSRWNVEGGLGTDFIVGGTAFDASNINPGGLVLNDIDMEDAYDTAKTANIGISRALNPNRKVTAALNYTQADGQDFALGSIGGINQTGELSDYKSIGIEAGLRQYFQPRVYGIGMRPYVEGKLGAAKIDDIDLKTGPVGGAQSTLEFYEGGWVPTAAALVGIETPAFKHATLGLETGIRYTGELDQADSLNGTPYAGANKDGSRLSIPLTIRGRYRF